jgi:hypothetical protein
MAVVSRSSVLPTAVVVAAVWAAAQGLGYAMNPATRHRAESAWFIFGVVLLLAAPSIGRGFLAGTTDPAPAISFKRVVVVFLSGAFILYLPTLGIGLLSDDFVLLERASGGKLVDPTWEYVRPVPLLIWQFVATIFPSALIPVTLHALNTALHGLNASLVSVCANRFGLPSLTSWLAGFLFLCWPSSVEAVVWASGVFDLLMTTLILTCAVVILSDRPAPLIRALLIAALAAAAVGSKETAIALPLLLMLLWPFVKVGQQRAAIFAIASASSVVLLYVGWRLASAVSTAHVIPVSGYAAKEIISRPFGALAIPFHSNVLETIPLLAPVMAIAWPIAFAVASRRWQRTPHLFKLLAFSALWVLASVLPLSTMLFVADDLQGSRYLYLAAATWSLASIILIVGTQHPVRSSALMIAVLLVAASMAGMLAHQRPWVAAAALRDEVLEALQRLPADCAEIDATGLPDHHDGAYIFRNGFTEAARMVRGVPSTTAAPCQAHWDGEAFIAGRAR